MTDRVLYKLYELKNQHFQQAYKMSKQKKRNNSNEKVVSYNFFYCSIYTNIFLSGGGWLFSRLSMGKCNPSLRTCHYCHAKLTLKIPFDHSYPGPYWEKDGGGLFNPLRLTVLKKKPYYGGRVKYRASLITDFLEIGGDFCDIHM